MTYYNYLKFLRFFIRIISHQSTEVYILGTSAKTVFCMNSEKYKFDMNNFTARIFLDNSEHYFTFPNINGSFCK
jgi:hypothetical protein